MTWHLPTLVEAEKKLRALQRHALEVINPEARNTGWEITRPLGPVLVKCFHLTAPRPVCGLQEPSITLSVIRGREPAATRWATAF